MTRSSTLSQEDDFAQRAGANRDRLGSVLKSRYDFIVCGSGSVSAGRLAQNADVNMLPLDAGGDDSVPNLLDAVRWPTNIGSERDWGFRGMQNPRLNGHSIDFAMSKVLGGGSSINGVISTRSHRRDWDFFAAEPAANGLRSFRRRDRPLPGLVDPCPRSAVLASRSAFTCAKSPLSVP